MFWQILASAGVSVSVATGPPSPAFSVDSVRCAPGVYSYDCPSEHWRRDPPKALPSRSYSCPAWAHLRLASGVVVCDSRLIDRVK